MQLYSVYSSANVESIIRSGALVIINHRDYGNRLVKNPNDRDEPCNWAVEVSTTLLHLKVKGVQIPENDVALS